MCRRGLPLQDGELALGQSPIIIEHCGGERLIPSLDARLWDRLCDQYIAGPVQALVELPTDFVNA